jgi:hypothetical protein
MAVIYSGDGGWRDLDKEIGEHLSQRGVPVVGVDSLRYFWTEKKPDEIAKDLAEIIESYGDRFGTKQVLLVGYSFGAAVLPFAVSRLPAEVARASARVLPRARSARRLPVPRRGLARWRARRDGTARAARAAQARHGSRAVLLRRGQDDSLCRDPGLAGADVIETKGGHHFDGGYGAIAQRIYDAAVKHLPPSRERARRHSRARLRRRRSSRPGGQDANRASLRFARTNGSAVVRTPARGALRRQHTELDAPVTGLRKVSSQTYRCGAWTVQPPPLGTTRPCRRLRAACGISLQANVTQRARRAESVAARRRAPTDRKFTELERLVEHAEGAELDRALVRGGSRTPVISTTGSRFVTLERPSRRSSPRGRGDTRRRRSARASGAARLERAEAEPLECVVASPLRRP